MKLIKKTLLLRKADYYETHLSIINGVLNPSSRLTPMEITVLARFMCLEGDLVAHNRFCTAARKVVKLQLDLSDGGLGNYLKAFRIKGIVLNGDHGIEVINNAVTPEHDEQLYQFKLVKKKNV